jgi:hypothetical protein
VWTADGLTWEASSRNGIVDHEVDQRPAAMDGDAPPDSFVASHY